MEKTPSPVVLIIVDGWGIRQEERGNAYAVAKKPRLTKLFASFPSSLLLASEEAVGLPHGQAGNSEVGHLNLGAGRIVYQEVLRINRSITDGSFWSNPAFLAAVSNIRKNKTKLHLLGLVSSGGVHSLVEHLYALLWFCREQGLEKKAVKIHVITDGRDAQPTSAAVYIAELRQKLAAIGIGEIATVMGRYYAMDRNNRWERTRAAYEALVDGKGEKGEDPLALVEKFYQNGVTDEFILPSLIIDETGQPVGKISDGDSIIFFNFRGDRTRQLTKAFVLTDFNEIVAQRSSVAGHEILETTGFTQQVTKTKTFDRITFLKNLFFVTLTEYEKDLPVSAIASPASEIKLPLTRIIAEASMRQFHIAETEKYPHVTYFFNGGREDAFVGEDRLLVPSAKIPTYDLAPAMSARQITEALLPRLTNRTYHFIVVNFANLDMVGHTGRFDPAVAAVEIVDDCVGQIVINTLTLGGVAIVTSDHGNIEEMLNPYTGAVDTEHNKNPVPIIVCWEKLRGKRSLKSGILADIAPTILEILKIQKPQTMTGISLL